MCVMSALRYVLQKGRALCCARAAVGEIIPQAACSRYGLQIGAYSAPFVKASCAQLQHTVAGGGPAGST